MVQTFDMSRRDNGTNKSNSHSRGLDHHVETTEFVQLDIMLRKASEARVDRRLRPYYLIVLLLSTVFTLACLPLSSI